MLRVEREGLMDLGGRAHHVSLEEGVGGLLFFFPSALLRGASAVLTYFFMSVFVLLY